MLAVAALVPQVVSVPDCDGEYNHEPMVIDHLNTYLEGGAATAAVRIHESLAASGINSRFWYGRPPHAGRVPAHAYQIRWPPAKGNPLQRVLASIAAVGAKRLLKWRLRRSFLGQGTATELFTTPFYAGPTRFDPRQLSGDVLHLHWVSAMLDFASFFASVPDEHPIVWTLHDVNLCTGGCHYPGDCTAFESECRACPVLKQPGPRDLSNRSFEVKQNALRGKNLHIVANSRWTEAVARRSPILAGARSIRTIHYGLDATQFAPQEKLTARRQLGLPADAPVVAFGAHRIDVRRKGLAELVAALHQIRTDRPIIALCFGGGDMSWSRSERIEFRTLGELRSPAELVRAYSAADLFVIPSLQEAFGQTGIEALSCETPVVGFRAGGIPDFVRHEETGLLADAGDVADLGRQIERLLQRPSERARIGKTGRQLVLSEFSPRRSAEQYADLYRSLLPARNRQASQAA